MNELPSPKNFYEEQITTPTPSLPITNSPSRLLSYEEILNILCSPPSTIKSIESQTEEQIDDQKEIIVYRLIYILKHLNNNNNIFFRILQ